MFDTFNSYYIMLGWIIALVLMLAVSLPMFLWIFDKITKEIDFWKELKRKNMAVGFVVGCAVLGACILIGLAIR
jgi:uncharacterized membrane protein YjfL (UPF0719 family)